MYYVRESFKFMPFVLQVTNLLRCGWKYIIAAFFGDSISGEVQSLLRVLEKPTVTALSHLFAGLKLPTMEKKNTKIELRSFASQNPKNRWNRDFV